MNILSLNDDVLINIFSFLYGRDALHMSLTSWRAHDLAISRVSSTAICRTPEDVIRMHKYMLGPTVGKSGPRARYLHMLNVSYMAFNRWCTQLPDASHRDGASALNTSMAKLVDEILIQATNLRSLSIDMLSICIKVDYRVRKALASMTRLINLRMWLVADTTLQRTIQSLPKSLSRVILHCRHTSPGTITLPPFLSALSILPNLRSITLYNFEPPSPVSPATLPLLPSVRHLRLERCWESAMVVADCCPGLETLKVSLSRCSQEPLQSARRWPSLLQLTVADQVAWQITHRSCVSSVHALELGDVFPVSSIPSLPDIIPSGFQNTFEHVYDALSLIFCTRPSALRVTIRVSKTGFNGSLGISRPTILEDIAAVAPQLRALDLVLKPTIIQRWRDMLGGLSGELGLFKGLEYLHVILPNVPLSYHWESDMDRATVTEFFIGEVVAFVPTLKVLGVSRVKPEQWGPPAELNNVDGWDLQEQMESVVHGMWRRLYGPTSVVLITREEGERVRSDIVGTS